MAKKLQPITSKEINDRLNKIALKLLITHPNTGFISAIVDDIETIKGQVIALEAHGRSLQKELDKK